MKKLWQSLEGNKTKIGFCVLSLGKVISMVKPEYGLPMVVAGYVFSGVGLADAIRRAVLNKGE